MEGDQQDGPLPEGADGAQYDASAEGASPLAEGSPLDDSLAAADDAQAADGGEGLIEGDGALDAPDAGVEEAAEGALGPEDGAGEEGADAAADGATGAAGDEAALGEAAELPGEGELGPGEEGSLDAPGTVTLDAEEGADAGAEGAPEQQAAALDATEDDLGLVYTDATAQEQDALGEDGAAAEAALAAGDEGGFGEGGEEAEEVPAPAAAAAAEEEDEEDLIPADTNPGPASVDFYGAGSPGAGEEEEGGFYPDEAGPGEGGEGEGYYGASGGASSPGTASTVPELPALPLPATLALEPLGLGDDITTSIPQFANAANRALHEKLLARKRLLATVARERAEHEDRLSTMRGHLHNVKQELVLAQEVLTARNKEVTTEDHLKQLTERAVGRMKQEIAVLDKRADGVSAQLASVQASIHRTTERLDAFRGRMSLVQASIDEWVAAAKKREEDATAIDRYSRADATKVKDLLRELAKVGALVVERKRALEAEAAETRARQLEMDKVAEDFRTLHAERQALVAQWQDALATVSKRDRDIAGAAESFAKIKASVAERRSRIGDAEAVLARLERANEELQERVTQLSVLVGDKRGQLNRTTEQARGAREEVELIKAGVLAASSDLAATKATNAALAKDLVQREASVEASKVALGEQRERLAQAQAATSSAEKALIEREAYLKREEARLETAQRRLELLKEALFKANEAVLKLRGQEESVKVELEGVKRTSRNMSDRVADLDARTRAQQERVYAAEFQVQEMEKKMARAQGEVSDEERVVLDARIAELQAELEEAKGLEKGLLAQGKEAKEDLKVAQRRQAALTTQLVELQGRIDEMLLQVHGAEDTLRAATKGREEVLIASDGLKVEVRRQRELLSLKTDEVYALENRAAQLAITMDLRKREVGAAKQVQRATLKLLEEERHKLALDLGDRQARIAVLKSKYESLCAKLRGSDGGGGEEVKSQAYYMLKAAQAREELQRAGDELDATIQTLERECKALATTLGHVTHRNEALREAYGHVDKGGEEALVVKQLETQARQVAEALIARRRDLAAMNGRIEDTNTQADEMSDKVAALGQQLDGLLGSLRQAERERDEQEAALEGSKRRVGEAQARHRSTYAIKTRVSAPESAIAGCPTPQELLFFAQGARESNASVLFTLGQLTREFPQLKGTLAAAMAELGLKMPARPPSRLPTAGVGAAGAGPGLPLPPTPPATASSLPASAAAGGVSTLGVMVFGAGGAGAASRPASRQSAAASPASPAGAGVGVGGLDSPGLSVVSAHSGKPPASRGGLPAISPPSGSGLAAVRGHSAAAGGRPGSATSQRSNRSAGSGGGGGGVTPLTAAAKAARGGGGSRGGTSGGAGLDLGITGTGAGGAGLPSIGGSRPGSRL